MSGTRILVMQFTDGEGKVVVDGSLTAEEERVLREFFATITCAQAHAFATGVGVPGRGPNAKGLH